jgi:GWxTD domain-containing protein
MPLSLTDLDIATLPLQYITTEDEYSALREGGRSSRIEKFDEFWSKKDPTPETAYNEMMAEFYKRVDIATAAYRTLKEQNGALTDRGKIFILYGKPTTTDRMLKPGDVPREIWKYSFLKKMFVFEDPSRQGNYKLTESK